MFSARIAAALRARVTGAVGGITGAVGGGGIIDLGGGITLNLEEEAGITITPENPMDMNNPLVNLDLDTGKYPFISLSAQLFGSFGLSTKEPYTVMLCPSCVIILHRCQHQCWHQHWHLCTPPPGTGLDIETSYLVHTCKYAPPYMHI